MEPARKPRLPLVIGLLLIATGITLLVLLTSDPMGALPGMPNAWKGGPMLLGAGFCSIVGAFLIVLRRFSLAGFLVGGIVSAGLAAAGNSFVLSFRDVRQDRIHVNVPENEQELFIKRMSERVTAERLMGMLNSLYDAGELSKPPNFDGIKISWGASSSNSRSLTLSLDYEYSHYLHTQREPIHELVTRYARALAAVSAVEAALAKGRLLILEHSWMATMNRGSAMEDIESLCGSVIWLSDNASRRRSSEELEEIFNREIRILEVLLQSEQDASIKQLLNDVQMDVTHAIQDGTILLPRRLRLPAMPATSE